MTEWKPRSIYS